MADSTGHSLAHGVSVIKCSADASGKKSNTRPSVIATVAPAWRSANVSQLGATVPCMYKYCSLQWSSFNVAFHILRLRMATFAYLLIQVTSTIPLALTPQSRALRASIEHRFVSQAQF